MTDPKDQKAPTDFSKFTVSQDFAATTPANTVLMAVPVGKPGKMDVIRCSENLRQTVYIWKVDSEEIYLVLPSLAVDPKLAGLIKQHELIAYITRKGAVKLWAIAVPDSEGKIHDYPASAREIANAAVGRWLRVTTNKQLSVYEPVVTEVDVPDPRWPDKTMEELLRLAFSGKIIDTEDHPLLLEFLGQA